MISDEIPTNEARILINGIKIEITKSIKYGICSIFSFLARLISITPKTKGISKNSRE